VEGLQEALPTGQRNLAKPCPKDAESRTFGVRQVVVADAVVPDVLGDGVQPGLP
jgi:hypothetical protein